MTMIFLNHICVWSIKYCLMEQMKKKIHKKVEMRLRKGSCPIKNVRRKFGDHLMTTMLQPYSSS